MPDLEEQLADLASAIAWPPTPNLNPIHGEVLGEARRWGRTLALVAAAVLVVVAALLAVPPTRDAIASWLNLHTLIHRTNNVPTPSPQPSGPLGQRLGLGTPTTLSAAQGSVTWQIALPSSLGQPDEVYYQAPPTGPSGGEVTLVYSSRAGIESSGETGVAVLITEARGRVDEPFFGKMLGPDTTLVKVSVGGHQGYWIAGQPHVFFFIDAEGNFRNETMRLATNTLIFDDGGTIVRIEGDLTKDQALQIGASMQ